MNKWIFFNWCCLKSFRSFPIFEIKWRSTFLTFLKREFLIWENVSQNMPILWEIRGWQCLLNITIYGNNNYFVTWKITFCPRSYYLRIFHINLLIFNKKYILKELYFYTRHGEHMESKKKKKLNWTSSKLKTFVL